MVIEASRRITGVASIKQEYILSRSCPTDNGGNDDDATERNTNPATAHLEEQRQDEDSTDPSQKRIKLSGAAKKRLKRDAEAEKRKAHRGQNKGRKFGSIRDDLSLCNRVAQGQTCERPNCRYSHSLKDYLEAKPSDIFFPRPPVDSQQGCLIELEPGASELYLDRTYSTTPPYIRSTPEDGKASYCPVLANQMVSSSSRHTLCHGGWACRFLGGHIRDVGEGNGADGTQWQLVGADEEVEGNGQEGEEDDAARRNAPDECNWPAPGLLRSLRQRKYPFYLTRAVLKHMEQERAQEKRERGENAPFAARGPIYIDEERARREDEESSQRKVSEDVDDLDEMMNEGAKERLADAAHSTSLVDYARLKAGEKRRLDWFHDELYLAPLTTTGNLPFRRLCTSLGADITCGEMGLADCYLQGQKNEWSLVRRWEGERCFGTQLCGNKPELLAPAAEVLAREFPSGLDFIDVNCGCPIDLVYNKGAGSALLDRPSKLGSIVRSMSAVSGDIPITIKLRTGTSSSISTTHKFFPKIRADWTASAVTLHGRSRQQRYKNLADWDYIRQCTTSLRESILHHNEERPDEDWIHPIPIYGNGDVFSWHDYERNKTATGVDGQMLARGALIKPWLFSEIKEKRDWDISSRERLDLIRQLTSYGLTHWGSDTLGVNTTRRFVCESLSFTHRYIPVGILERVPVQLNERPLPFKGRDELETLLASGNAQDWVKITEMFLGKAPESFNFIPKHKSNSYDNDGAEDQG